MADARSRQLETILQGGVIAVMRGVEPDDAVAAAEALAAGGITAVEVTAETPGVMASLNRVTEAMADRSVAVGAGTVLDAGTAGTMLRHGAEFVVSPTFAPEVVETANRAGVPVIPGVMTPTEATKAYAAGADAVKLFPATTVGPDHIQAVHGPLPQLTILPTGGVDRENAPAFLEAGAAGIGVGSALVDQAIIANERWDELTERATGFVELVERHRD